MADISQENKQEMQATASGLDYQSLGDAFTQQYNRLVGVQEAQDAYTPQASQNARAVGDVSDRAAGEAPVQIAQQGMALTDRIGQIKEGTTSSILDTLSTMLNLKQQERQEREMLAGLENESWERNYREKELQMDMLEKGIIYDDELGDFRAMNPEEMAEVGYSSNPLALLKQQSGGEKILSTVGASIEDRKATAESIISMGKETLQQQGLDPTEVGINTVMTAGMYEYAQRNPEKVFTKKENESWDNLEGVADNAREAYAIIDTLKGMGVSTETGPVLGRIPKYLANLGIFTDKKANTLQNELRNQIGGVQNKMLLEISGAQVTDQEYERLLDILPDEKQDLLTLKNNLEEFITAVDIGKQMQVISTLEGISTKDAYIQYAPELFRAEGFSVPQWVLKEREKAGLKENEENENRIRVKEKSSGQTGTIEADEFNPELYEKI